MSELANVGPEFLNMAHQIVWCSAATVDADGALWVAMWFGARIARITADGVRADSVFTFKGSIDYHVKLGIHVTDDVILEGGVFEVQGSHHPGPGAGGDVDLAAEIDKQIALQLVN